MLHPKDKFKEDIIIDIKSEDQAAIDTKINLQKFSEYTVTDILAKTSSSNTIICKVTNLDKKQYFKIGLMDTSPENNIDYELYVYEYLFSKREEEPEIPKYFMDYDKEISGICTFNDFIHNINMTSELKKNLWMNQ